ncbi:hypothetical protein [Paenibacillus sp. 1_12]|uniref:hypothetical protein n=1 Tax=Paenibacillus sp. 1_12 TaxID=1566278 RepID=UPI0015A5EB11|nr:hypothetical protein [Paenibacillus sp. 1_12]
MNQETHSPSGESGLFWKTMYLPMQMGLTSWAKDRKNPFANSDWNKGLHVAVFLLSRR